MPPYPYSMDPAFGPVPMLTEADKMREMAASQSPQIKEERSKDSSSPNDHPKVIVNKFQLFEDF